jgi:hypothetical protein
LPSNSTTASEGAPAIWLKVAPGVMTGGRRAVGIMDVPLAVRLHRGVGVALGIGEGGGGAQGERRDRWKSLSCIFGGTGKIVSAERREKQAGDFTRLSGQVEMRTGRQLIEYLRNRPAATRARALFSSLNHWPRSISLQRWEQNGPHVS